MKSFKKFIKEGRTNKIDKSETLSSIQFTDYADYNENEGNPPFKLEKHPDSVTDEHHIYTQNYTDYNKKPMRKHLWVNKKTGTVDLSFSANVNNKGKDTVYSNIDLIGTGRKGIAHHAYYDLMRRGVVLSHSNQSQGAVKVSRKVRKTYPDVVAHVYDPEKKEATHYTHGILVNPTKESKYKGKGLYRAVERRKYVQFLPDSKRIKSS